MQKIGFGFLYACLDQLLSPPWVGMTIATWDSIYMNTCRSLFFLRPSLYLQFTVGLASYIKLLCLGSGDRRKLYV